MKLNITIIKPFKSDEISKALAPAEVHGLTASQVNEFDRRKGAIEPYQGEEYVINFLSK